MSVTDAILAVHNEEEYLPYSLASLKDCDVDRLILVFDRCSDGSSRVVSTSWTRPVLAIHREFKGSWRNSCAEAKAVGLNHADSDFVFMTDADLSVDCVALREAKVLLEHDLFEVVFLVYRQYSLFGSWTQRVRDEWINLLNILIRRLKIHPTRTGVYLVRNDSIYLTDHPSEYDEATRQLRSTFIRSRSLHLRPRYDVASQKARGRARAIMPHYGLVKVLLSSLIDFQPFMFVGYLEARR